MSNYDDSDFVALGTGIPVQFGFYNKNNGIREQDIAAAKPFNTTPNTGANSHGTEETIIGDHEPEYVTSPDGQMEIVYDEYAYENEDFVSPNGQFNQDYMRNGNFQNGNSQNNHSQNSHSKNLFENDQFENPSAQSGRYSEMTSMASPTKNQPFNTQTTNDAIWGEDEKATLHIDKEDNKTGLTKITINTSGGDPKIEDVTHSQIGGIRPLTDPGVTIESNYQNDGQGDGGQGETNVTIKRIGGDEIKVNNAATPSMLGRPNLKQRGNKIEVRPGVRVTQGAADMAMAMQSALGGLGNPGTSSSNTGQTTSRAQQMFLARKSRSKQFEKTSMGQGSDDKYNPGQREYVSEDDDDENNSVYSDSDSAPTPVPTKTFDDELDFGVTGSPEVVAIAAYDSIGDENLLKNLEGKDLSPIPTPIQMKGKGAGLFQKQGVRMDKYTLEKQEKERVDTLMELEKLTGKDLWQGNLDNRGNIIGIEKNRAKSYTETNVGVEDDEKYTTTSETVRNAHSTTTHSTTQFQSSHQSTSHQSTSHQSTSHQSANYQSTNNISNEPMSFTRPGAFHPVSNNYQADVETKQADHIYATNPLSALPNAPSGLKTTFQENNAPWNAPQVKFGSIRAPSGPQVPQSTPVKPERRMFSNQETGPQGTTEIVMPKINRGPEITKPEITKPDFNKAIHEIQTKKHVTFNEKTAIQPIYNEEEDHVFENYSLPTPAAPKPIDFSAQRNLVQNVIQQSSSSSDVPDKQLMCSIPVNDDLIKEAVKSTHVLDVVKTGTGVITEKQRLLLEEEEKKKKEMEKRYSMYTDFIEDDIKTKEDPSAVLNKLEMLDKKLEKNSKFEAAQPDDFVDQSRFDDQEHVKQMGNFLPKSHLKTPTYKTPNHNAPLVPTHNPTKFTPQNAYNAPMSNFDDFQNSVFGSLQTQTTANIEPPMSTPISSFPPPPPRPSGGALGSSQILQNLKTSPSVPSAPSTTTPWAPSTGFQPVKIPTNLPSPRNSSSSDISFKKIQGYQPSKAWTPSAVQPVSTFKVPGKYNLDVPVVLPDTTPILPPQVPISSGAPPLAPPVPGTEYKPIKKQAVGSYSPTKPNQQFNTPKPAQNFGGAGGGPVMMPVDFTKGKGAKMFEKQQARMGKYTRTIGDEKAKDIKQAHLTKKKAIEDGTYMPSHGPAPMASVLPTGPPTSRPSHSSSRQSNSSSNRPVAPAQRKSVIPPSSSKINSYNAPMGSLDDFMSSVGGSLAPQQYGGSTMGMDFTKNQAVGQQKSAVVPPSMAMPTSSTKPMNDYSAPMGSLDDFMASVGGSTAMGMDFATKLMK